MILERLSLKALASTATDLRPAFTRERFTRVGRLNDYVPNEKVSADPRVSRDQWQESDSTSLNTFRADEWLKATMPKPPSEREQLETLLKQGLNDFVSTELENMLSAMEGRQSEFQKALRSLINEALVEGQQEVNFHVQQMDQSIKLLRGEMKRELMALRNEVAALKLTLGGFKWCTIMSSVSLVITLIMMCWMLQHLPVK